MEELNPDTDQIETLVDHSDNCSSNGNYIKRRQQKTLAKTLPKRQHLIWDDEEVTSSKWPNTRLLPEGHICHKETMNHFLLGMRLIDPGVTITSIHMRTHKDQFVLGRFQIFRRQIEITEGIRGTPNIVSAWYGASGKVVESVLVHGFGVPSKVFKHESYGVGVYLSPLGTCLASSKFCEEDENGEKHIIYCKVILGNIEKVEKGSTQCFPSSVDFDSGSDDPECPNWYIIWPSKMSTHIYPNFVVSFRSSPPAQVKGSGSMKSSNESLLAKMKSLLTMDQIRGVKIACNLYKDGKLSKIDYVKLLKKIARVEKLHALNKHMNMINGNNDTESYC